MSTVYDEGPFKNWAAIHFPGDLLVCRYIIGAPTGSAARRVLRWTWENGDGDLVPGQDPEDLQGLITGKESGATLDVSQIQVTWYMAFNREGGTPCRGSFLNWSTLPNGIPFSGLDYGPRTGANISPDVPGPEINVFVTLQSVGSEDANYDPDFCTVNNDAPTLPEFIDGETCTLTYPE